LHLCSYSQTRGLITQSKDTKSAITRLPSKAVLIANYTYDDNLHYPCLDEPPKDVLKLEKLLKEKYDFESIEVYSNLSGDSLKAIFKSLKEFTGDLFIFYAGHGDKTISDDREVSFIVPVDFIRTEKDALEAVAPSYFTYGKLVSKMQTNKSFNAKHFLFVSDACYAGMDDFENYKSRSGIGEQEDLFTAYDNDAAKYLASNKNNPVSDKSDFLKAFIQVLDEEYYNDKVDWISSTQLDGYLTTKRNQGDKDQREKQGYTTNNHVFKNLREDYLGDFIFFKKNQGNSNSASLQGGSKQPQESINKVKCIIDYKISDIKSSDEILLKKNCNAFIEERCPILSIPADDMDDHSFYLKFEFNLKDKKKPTELIIDFFVKDEKIDNQIISLNTYIKDNAIDWTNLELRKLISKKCEMMVHSACGDRIK
jgi:hypothetical protein